MNKLNGRRVIPAAKLDVNGSSPRQMWSLGLHAHRWITWGFQVVEKRIEVTQSSAAWTGSKPTTNCIFLWACRSSRTVKNKDRTKVCKCARDVSEPDGRTGDRRDPSLLNGLLATNTCDPGCMSDAVFFFFCSAHVGRQNRSPSKYSNRFRNTDHMLFAVFHRDSTYVFSVFSFKTVLHKHPQQRPSSLTDL